MSDIVEWLKKECPRDTLAIGALVIEERLHEAAGEIESLRQRVAELEDQIDTGFYGRMSAKLQQQLAAVEKERDELRQKIAECQQYLKDGETPAERMARYHHDIQGLIRQLGAALKERDELKRLPSPDVTWLFTHCRAIGMTEKSLSGEWEDDIALFTTRLKEQLAASQVREQKMREALESIANTPHMHQDRYTESALETALKALALPHDTPPVRTKDTWFDKTLDLARKEHDNYIDAAMKLGAGETAPDLNIKCQGG